MLIIDSIALTQINFRHWHNLTFYQDLMAQLRRAIAERRLTALVGDIVARYEGSVVP